MVSLFSWILERPIDRKSFTDFFLQLIKDLCNNEQFLLKDDLFNINRIFLGKDLNDFVYNNNSENIVSISEFLKSNYDKDLGDLIENISIYIPTKETIKATYISNLSLVHMFPIMLYGGTSTGKTLVTKGIFKEMQNLNSQESNLPSKYTVLGFLKPSFSNYIALDVILNAKTTANNLCDIMEEKVSYKLKKNILAPSGNKTCIMLIEDLNMPLKEKFGAQPPIEIIRQNFDYGGWYDRKENDFLYMKNVLFYSCLTLGRPVVSSRLMWHFYPVFLRDLDETNMKSVYQMLYSSLLSKYPNSVRKLEIGLTDTLINTYSSILTNFKPLPITPHYCFNIRDLSKIFNGFTMISSESLFADLNPSERFYLLSAHEIFRVFYDRLVNESDRNKFVSIVTPILEKAFNINFSNNHKEDEIKINKSNDFNNIGNHHNNVSKSKNNFNANYYDNLCFSDILSEEGNYIQIQDIEILKNKLEEYLIEFNQGKRSKDRMNLIFFDSPSIGGAKRK